jgi:hypothetical protein
MICQSFGAMIVEGSVLAKFPNSDCGDRSYRNA